jgi:hypothetical protein
VTVPDATTKAAEPSGQVPRTDIDSAGSSGDLNAEPAGNWPGKGKTVQQYGQVPALPVIWIEGNAQAAPGL